jgi:cytoskeletal protein RodZ
MKRNQTRKRNLVVPVILLALSAVGMDSAKATETITQPSQTITQPSQTITQPSQTITPAPSATPTISQSITPPSTSTTKPSGLIMRWVCKTLSTTVAVSAWVYTVVVTDGVAMVVAREIIRYVTVPAIVCDWFF